MKNETEKLSKFSQMLSKMRKERGISQKKAATDLGISQALLSHYEKGIRECGEGNGHFIQTNRASD